MRISDYERFDAIRDTPGILGCTRSHAECLIRMIRNGWDCVMICEDDARFRVSRADLDVLVESFLNDPQAEVACLAYNHCRPPKPYNPLFVRAPDDTRSAACYLVKSSIAPDLLALFEKGIRGLSRGGSRDVYGSDMIWRGLQQDRVFLLPIKRAVFQAAGFSDVEGKVVDYGGL